MPGDEATRCASPRPGRTTPSSSCPAFRSGCSEPCCARWPGSADGSLAAAGPERGRANPLAVNADDSVHPAAVVGADLDCHHLVLEPLDLGELVRERPDE